MFNCMPELPYPSNFQPNHCLVNEPSYHFPSIFTRYFLRESIWEDSEDDPTGIFLSFVSAIRSPFVAEPIIPNIGPILPTLQHIERRFASGDGRIEREGEKCATT